MLSSGEQAFVGRDEMRAPLKMPAWEAIKFWALCQLSVNPIQTLNIVSYFISYFIYFILLSACTYFIYFYFFISVALLSLVGPHQLFSIK